MIDETIQVSNTEPLFVTQWQGEDVTIPTSLSAMLAANSDDPDLCEWLKSAPVDGCRMYGGGSAPMCWVRRVA